MPQIPVDIRNFPNASGVQNGNRHIDISWQELIWAALSVGKGSLAHMQQHGQYSKFEMTYRAAVIYSNLLESGAGFFDRTLVYNGLDPSEKSAISYAVGMAVSKAFVSKELNVPWLMHVDVYRQAFNLNILPTGQRPDLFGEDLNNRWVVIESKGRTNGHDPDALNKAKTQASQISAIGGIAPYLSAGIVVSFVKNRMSLIADDPPVGESDTKYELPIERRSFRAQYYEPFRAILRESGTESEEFNGRRVRVTRLDSVDLHVGLEEAAILDELRPAVDSIDDANRSAFLGTDGLYVRLGPSWRDFEMRREPQSRGT